MNNDQIAETLGYGYLKFSVQRSCDPGGTQTRDTQNRNLMLYSTELRGLHFSSAKIDIKDQQAKFDTDKAKKLFNLLVITYETRIFADIKGWGTFWSSSFVFNRLRLFAPRFFTDRER